MRKVWSARAGAVIAATAIASLGVLAVSSAASAATGPRIWVNDTVVPVAGNGTSCAQPGFTSVQAAVTAAETHGTATVLVCPGTYAEQVQVTKPTNLTIEAATPGLGATFTLPATPADSTTPCDTAPGTGAFQPDQDGLAVCGHHHTTVTVKNLTFDEAWPANTCDDSLFGILVGGNDTLKLEDSAIVAGGDVPINGCQGGVGLQVGMAWTTPVEKGHLVLTDTTVSGYQKNGVTIDGAGSTATISYDTVEGAGPTTQTAQNGIQVSNGAYATITHSTIEDNECDNATCGPNGLSQYQAGGVLFYGARIGSSISQCVIKHNDYGVYFGSELPSLSFVTESSVKFSTISDNRDENVLLDQGRDLVASDRVEGGLVGVELLQYQGQAYGEHDSVVSSVLKYSSHAAVEVLSDKAATGDYPGSVVFKDDAIRGPILSNSSTYTVTFEH